MTVSEPHRIDITVRNSSGKIILEALGKFKARSSTTSGSGRRFCCSRSQCEETSLELRDKYMDIEGEIP